MKRITTTILIMVLVAALVFVARFSVAPILCKNANYGMSRLINEGKVNHLFIGSSMFRQGIDSCQIITNDSSYNLNYNENQPWEEYMQLKEILDNGVDIGTVYVDMYVGTIIKGVKFSDTRCLQGTTFKYTKDLFAEYLKYIRPSINDIHEWFFTCNNELYATYPISIKIINNRYHLGNSTTNKLGKTKEELNQLDGGIVDSDAKINTIQLDYIYKIIDLCNKNGIKVVFIETPKYEKLYLSNDAYKRVMKEYIELASKHNCLVVCSDKTYPQCDNQRVIKYNYDISNPGYFTDLVHLSADGRDEFSGVLKQVLR